MANITIQPNVDYYITYVDFFNISSFGNSGDNNAQLQLTHNGNVKYFSPQGSDFNQDGDIGQPYNVIHQGKFRVLDNGTIQGIWAYNGQIVSKTVLQGASYVYNAYDAHTFSGDSQYVSTTPIPLLENEQYNDTGLLPEPIIQSINPEPGNLGYQGDLYRVIGENLRESIQVYFIGKDSQGNITQTTSETTITNITEDKTEGFVVVPEWLTNLDSNTVNVCAVALTNEYCHPFDSGYGQPQMENMDIVDGTFSIPITGTASPGGFNVLYDAGNGNSATFTIPDDSPDIQKDGDIWSFIGNIWDYVDTSSPIDNLLDMFSASKEGYLIVLETITGQPLTDSSYEKASHQEVLDQGLVEGMNNTSEVQTYHPVSLLETYNEVENANVDECCKLTNRIRLLSLQKEMEMRFYELQAFRKAFLTRDGGMSVIGTQALWMAIIQGWQLSEQRKIDIYRNGGALFSETFIDPESCK
jgi:hypothetical protein